MFLLGLVNRPMQFGDGGSSGQRGPEQRQRRRVWRRFVNWLREPIPFPGMTFNFEPRQTRYNKHTSTLSTAARK
jgi:hypothetical protein